MEGDRAQQRHGSQPHSQGGNPRAPRRDRRGRQGKLVTRAILFRDGVVFIFFFARVYAVRREATHVFNYPAIGVRRELPNRAFLFFSAETNGRLFGMFSHGCTQGGRIFCQKRRV